ncbi:MAG: RNA polymerase sigma factor [Sphingobacteriaceae bacterium]|nr:RNA polymerase sigma factor [Sphingobacteriaceae bacterium]
MNRTEFSKLVIINSSSLQMHAMQFTRDLDDANDLVQDTLVKAIRFFHKFQEGTNLKGWLFVIMRNTFVNQYRSGSRRKSIMTSEEEINDSSLTHSAEHNAAENKLLMDDINKALSKLPDQYKIPFIRHFEGYKYHEIAKELGLPLGTIKTHIHQARIILKKQLEKYSIHHSG